MQSHLGTSYTNEDVKDYVLDTLNSGQVVVGYGHAVLRRPDPRYEALIRFASSRPEITQDPLFQLVLKTAEIVPGVLKQLGKVNMPHPFPFHPPFPTLHRQLNSSLTHRPKIRTPMSTPSRECSSITTASARRTTTPPPSASAADSARSRS